jgi:hypothetical protein
MEYVMDVWSNPRQLEFAENVERTSPRKTPMTTVGNVKMMPRSARVVPDQLARTRMIEMLSKSTSIAYSVVDVVSRV